MACHRDSFTFTSYIFYMWGNNAVTYSWKMELIKPYLRTSITVILRSKGALALWILLIVSAKILNSIPQSISKYLLLQKNGLKEGYSCTYNKLTIKHIIDKRREHNL
jgi:hypothetical protein